ncbi:MAG: bifunctional glutamate N-acetyltransferase/amino-acid acetyltransferase ArgJ [Christensenellaceae bacterium]
MEIKQISGGVCAPHGFMASGLHSGLKKNGRPDLALILSDEPCTSAAVYTQNKVKGAPILLTQRHLSDGMARGVLVNSGNANTCNPDGLAAAGQCAQLAADAAGCKPEDFIVASTGVIGQPLPLKPFQENIRPLYASLSRGGSAAAAAAIMTTDTKPKEFAVEFTLGGVPCRIGAIGKGSGMINPNMATMLIFITTDVSISSQMLDHALREETARSFNQICVDGDTSTNDMAALLANGKAGNPAITSPNDAYSLFCDALHDICIRMSRALAADGEGATKLIECHVSGAPTDEIARAVSKSVVSSDLVKAAVFGKDANWGRVLCAIGYTPGDFDTSRISLSIQSAAGEVLVCKNAAYHPFSEALAAKVLDEDEIFLMVDMGIGSCSARAFGCDLTYDYVKINGDYRT